MFKKRKSLDDFFHTPRPSPSCSTPADSKLSPWECVACTFVNHKRHEACELCLTKRTLPSASISQSPSPLNDSKRNCHPNSVNLVKQSPFQQQLKQPQEHKAKGVHSNGTRQASQTDSQIESRTQSETESLIQSQSQIESSTQSDTMSQETPSQALSEMSEETSQALSETPSESLTEETQSQLGRSQGTQSEDSELQDIQQIHTQTPQKQAVQQTSISFVNSTPQLKASSFFTPRSKQTQAISASPSLLCAQDPSLHRDSVTPAKSAFLFMSSPPSASNKTRSSVDLLRSSASASLLGPSVWTQLLHRLDQTMAAAKPQTASQWIDAVRSVCGHPCPSPFSDHQWGALVPSFRPTPSNMTKRSAPYCTGYVPVLQEDTRPPGCGDALYIDCIRRSQWSHPIRQPDSDEFEADKTFQAKNTIFILRVVANSGIFTPTDCKTIHHFLTDLPLEAQLLYATLFPHRGPWFRLDGYGVRARISPASAEFVPRLHDLGWIHVLNVKDLLFEAECKTPRAFDDEENEYIGGERGGGEGGSVSVCDVAFLLTLLTVKDLKDLDDYNSRKLLSPTIKALGPKAAALQQALQRILGVRNTLKKVPPKSGTLNSVWNKLGVCLRLKRTAFVQRAIRVFMLSAGYLPEEAVNVLLHIDLSTQTFASPTRDLQLVGSQSLLAELEQMVFLNAKLEAAVVLGDEDNAYLALQEAAILLNNAHRLSATGTGRMTVGWMAARIVMRGTALLEREKRFTDAIHYFRLILSCSDAEIGAWHRAQAYLRLVLDLEKIGEKAEALRICERGLSESCMQGSASIGLARICLRLSVPPRRWRIPSIPPLLQAPERHLTGRRPERGVWITDQGVVCHGVEAYVLACYQREGWMGCHAENSLWLTLINLLAFDILCPDRTPHPAEGQRQCELSSPYQDHPFLLWGSHMVHLPGSRHLVSSFYATCSSAVETRLQELREGRAAEILARAWVHCHRQALYINWNRHSLQQLQGICVGVGSEVLLKLVGAAFKTQLFEAVCCGGFPDLSLWKPGAVKFVEVKGPGDALSDKQRGLMHLLLEANADVEVCYVRESA